MTKGIPFPLIAASSTLMALAVAGPALAAVHAYMSTGGDTFGTIDLSTGLYTNIGSTSFMGANYLLSGLGVFGGHIYGGVDFGTQFFEVNPATGALSLIGSSSESFADTGSTTGALYELGADSNLYRINPATGATTLIGATGIPIIGTISMSVGGSQLFISQGGHLYLTNTTTGATTNVGSIAPANFGATADIGGTWWGGSNGDPNRVYNFDPSTAAVTAGADLSGTPYRFWGLTPVADVVPEPSTWAMMLLGFFGLGFLLRSRFARQAA